MKTTLALVLCLIFLMTSGSEKIIPAGKHSKGEITCTDTFGDNLIHLSQAGSGDSRNNTPACKGNGVVTFVNTSSQALWFYYWYPEDVINTANECRFRRFWKQLNAGNNLFAIPQNKTLIFRICTGPQCADNFIKQYGIVQYCNVNNGTISVQ